MKAKNDGLAVFAVSILLFLFVYGATRSETRPAESSSEGEAPPAAAPTPIEVHPSFLYGRIMTTDGAVYEGRLRWGGDDEAFWGNYFNGIKTRNPWAAMAPKESLPKENRSIRFFGIEVGEREHSASLTRSFMARFGDIASVEERGGDVRVTLKSGFEIVLDRSSAGDFDDTVRVWDRRQGEMDIESSRVRRIEFLPPPMPGGNAEQLYGVVFTRQGEFTGYLQWDWEECATSDELTGNWAEGDVRVRFDAIRSIARRSGDSTLVTLKDGRGFVHFGRGDGGPMHRGVYVDDSRYGRVLVSWDAFERAEFRQDGGKGGGPGYDDFPPGGPLMGSVHTRSGKRFAGRLVYDLDESEITDSLDAPIQGVNYVIPFGMVASIALPGRSQDAAGNELRARVTLRNGEELALERKGDLGPRNAGLLVFVDSRSEKPEYVPWAEVQEIKFDRPRAMYPALGDEGKLQ